MNVYVPVILNMPHTQNLMRGGKKNRKRSDKKEKLKNTYRSHENKTAVKGHETHTNDKCKCRW